MNILLCMQLLFMRYIYRWWHVIGNQVFLLLYTKCSMYTEIEIYMHAVRDKGLCPLDIHMYMYIQGTCSSEVTLTFLSSLLHTAS